MSALRRRANWNLQRSLLTRARKGRNALVPRLRSECPRRFALRSIFNLCKKHGGMYTTHTTCECCRFEKDGKEKSDFVPLGRVVRKVIP